MITLNLWVSDQVGVDCDATDLYIQGTGWTPPEGITLNLRDRTLTGEAEECWQAFRALAKLVANRGHGLDEEDDERCAGVPNLTACPLQLVKEGQSWLAGGQWSARRESLYQETWKDFVKAVPALQED